MRDYDNRYGVDFINKKFNQRTSADIRTPCGVFEQRYGLFIHVT